MRDTNGRFLPKIVSEIREARHALCLSKIRLGWKIKAHQQLMETLAAPKVRMPTAWERLQEML